MEQFNRGSIIVCALCYKSVCKVLLKTKIQCVRYNLIFRSLAQKKEDKIYVFCTKKINSLECGKLTVEKIIRENCKKKDKKKDCFWIRSTN